MPVPKVRVFNECKPAISINQKVLHLITNQIAADYGIVIKWINLINLDDNKHTEMNSRYLNHFYSTDVITFDLSNGPAIEGEIYTNDLVVKRNALDHSVSEEIELTRMFVHGLLHLVGMNDDTEASRLSMSLKEDLYLNRFM